VVSYVLSYILFLNFIIGVSTGFKSRVKFYSAIEPAKRCNYICEILDAGLLGPLFKVGI
jgi:F/Y-rich N-terminus